MAGVGETIKEKSELDKKSRELAEARAEVDAALDVLSAASRRLDECAEAFEQELGAHVGEVMPLEGRIRSIIWASDGREEGVLDWEKDPMNGHPSTRPFSGEARIVAVHTGLNGVLIDDGEDGSDMYRVVTSSISTHPADQELPYGQ